MQTFSNNKLKLTYTYFYGASHFNLLKSLFYLNLMGHFIKIELLSGTERIITLCVKILKVGGNQLGKQIGTYMQASSH